MRALSVETVNPLLQRTASPPAMNARWASHMPISIRFAFCLSVCVQLLGCSEASNSTGSISKRIGDVVHAPGATEVDLRKLPTFGWEYFYVSKPGVSREEVCKLIGAGRSVCGRIVRIAKAPDDHVYLLFGLNGQLTHIELHALANGQFDMQIPAEGFPKNNAVFRVRRSTTGSGEDAILLEPK